MDNINKLQELIQLMDIPDNRRTDINWLSRNLSIRNKNHVNFQEAFILIRQIIKNR